MAMIPKEVWKNYGTNQAKRLEAQGRVWKQQAEDREQRKEARKEHREARKEAHVNARHEPKSAKPERRWFGLRKRREQ